MVDRITAEKEIRGMVHKAEAKINGVEEKLSKKVNALFRESMIQYVTVFVIAFFMDSIAGYFHWQFKEGFGWQQIAVMAYCFMQVLRLYFKK